MNGDAPDEAVAARLFAAQRKAVLILEIRIQCIDRRHACRTRCEEALRARDPIRERPVPILFFVRQSAERRTQILGTPRHADEAAGGFYISAEAEHRGRRFGSHDEQLHMSRRNARGDLQNVEIVRKQFNVLSTIDFGYQNPVQARTHDSGEIVQRKPRSKRINPDQKRPIGSRSAQEVLYRIARERLAYRRNRVLKIENKRVCPDP